MVVLTYSEDNKLRLELLKIGRELADGLMTELTAVNINGGDEVNKLLLAHGADKVVDIVDTENEKLDKFKVEEYSDVLCSIIDDAELHPEIVLIGSTKSGKELAPRVAGRLKAGCAIDSVNLRLDDTTKNLIVERTVYGGNGVATYAYKTKPQIATIASKVYEIPEKDDSRAGEVIKKEVEIPEYSTKIVDIVEKETGGVNLEDAEVIISGGRGVKNKEDFKFIEELAGVLGAEVGCSRPIAADLKWLPENRWVGLSGRKVKPKLYITCGISGRIEHIAGIRDSGIIVAINNDPDASIFNACDYGLVGDLYKILPALTEAFKKDR